MGRFWVLLALVLAVGCSSRVERNTNFQIDRDAGRLLLTPSDGSDSLVFSLFEIDRYIRDEYNCSVAGDYILEEGRVERVPLATLPDGLPIAISCQKTARERAFERPMLVQGYPEADRTYLIFTEADGYTVRYLGADQRTTLWYPGNAAAVEEQWLLSEDLNDICLRSAGGQRFGARAGYTCTSLAIAGREVVAELAGDPFRLASGRIPFRRDRCAAPERFDFDRSRVSCR